MFCKHCGLLLNEDAKFCGGCGTAVEKAAPVVEAPAPVVEEPTPVVEAPAPVVEAPAPVVEAPAPVVEAPAPVVEAPAPIYASAPVVEASAPAYAQAPVYTPPVQPTYVPAPTQKAITEADLPEQYRPLSAWAYFGLQMLFSVPIVGFIFLIIFSFKRDNLNRRAFARSYWCALLIIGILLAVFLVIGIIAGVGAGSIISRSMYY